MSLLAVQGLTKRYGSHCAVDQLDFSLGEGRCVALLGPNGAGKTTTLKMLTGLLPPSSGDIQYQGKKLGRELRSLIGYLPQHPAFYAWMSGRDYLIYAARLHGLDQSQAQAAASEWLAHVGLEQAAQKRIGGYSGGMKQRLGLAQALIHRPPLLLLDEPISALDPSGREAFMTLLQTLKQRMTILFSTHILHDAAAICDDVLIISQGKLKLHGDWQTLQHQHRRPMIEIEVLGDEGQWLKQWEKHPLVTTMHVSGAKARLSSHHVEALQSALLQQLVADHKVVASLSITETSLDELYRQFV